VNPEAAKRLRLLASVATLLAALAVLVIAWYWWRIRASLPQLDGHAPVAGLAAPVTIERDALGVPTIRGRDRADIARALGWLHAQDRFFQIDLLRRSAAGELAELFGSRALPRDRAVRMHGFRRLAEQVVARVPAAQRQLLEAYTAGVNAGLAALGDRPFEYLVLRAEPQPWRAEDSVLIIYAMTLDLQDGTGRYERTLMTLRDELGGAALAFFNPLVGPNDAALDGSTAPLPPIPDAKQIDIRKKKLAAAATGRGEWQLAHQREPASPGAGDLDAFPFSPRDRESVQGSNAFALAGSHTATGAALLANDMHLDHAVPNIWYRASLEYSGRQATGVTLPGTPALVAGSNGRIAWGFTDAYADASDLVVVEVNKSLPNLYSAPGVEELQPIEQRKETIHVKGERDVVVEYPWTLWGPIVALREGGRPLALRWLAHDPAATDLALLELQDADTLDAGIRIAHRAGIPAQNILLADRAGDVAWTIAGRLPKRVGFDGRLPVSWSYGDRKWDGLLPPEEVPTVIERTGGGATGWGRGASRGEGAAGRLWSANQRAVGGDALAKIGDGNYPRPARAAQIRDDLAPLERATPRDLLAVQLDIKAKFLAPWHELMMRTLTPEIAAKKKSRATLRSFAEKWEGQASIEAVSYRLVREFRSAVYRRVFPAIFATCLEQFPQFDWLGLQLEPALWAMLRERPMNLLNPEFASWDDLLVAAADDVVTTLDKAGVTLPHANWGWRNTAQIRHPFGNIAPAWLGRWLDMPADPLPGDHDMPRVDSPTHGASERFVVAPGRESEGIFHMPCGQSGHPMSPYYRAGHEAWVRGEPTPFLPGQTAHTLTLTPSR